MNSKLLRVILIVGLAVGAALLAMRIVLAHGSMLRPISRIYACYLENPETPDTLACRDAIAAGGTQQLYDWNEVHLLNAGGNHRALIPDGKLCSAGMAKYSAFDQARPDWARTVLPASGTYTFLYSAYVPHNLGYFELYVTRDGYDPMAPLKWSDLEATPFLRVEYPAVVNGNYEITGALPNGKVGHHLIYAIWQRYDSAEAFYSCSDVWFGTSPTPTPTSVSTCTAPLWSASVVYQAGAQVSYDGRWWQARWSSSGQAPSTNGASNAWIIQGFCSGSGTGATSTPTRTPTPSLSPTRTATRSNTPTGATATATRTPTTTSTRSNTPTGATTTATRSSTPSVTPTSGTGATCSPVSATITAPFTFDGTGTFCWQTANLGTYINSWNLAGLTINGVNYTNLYVFTSNLPAKINGYWYVRYTGNYAWSHFEAK